LWVCVLWLWVAAGCGVWPCLAYEKSYRARLGAGGFSLRSDGTGAGCVFLFVHNLFTPAACSFGWWLMAGAGLFWEKYCWLVADYWFVLREKYCWLVADKPNEQGAETWSFTSAPGTGDYHTNRGCMLPLPCPVAVICLLGRY
jgi:hypothetical protein